MTSAEKIIYPLSTILPLSQKNSRRLILLLIAIAIFGGLTTLTHFRFEPKIHAHTEKTQSDWERFVQCSIANLDTSAVEQPFVEELPVHEYLQRRDRLAQALVEEQLDAFVMEPGFTEVYYANLSSFQWESWEPEERPFLLVIEPILTESGQVAARSTFITPAFELERALALNLPNDGPVTYIIWEEHENPFEVLAKYLNDSAESRIRPSFGIAPRIVCDDELRLFIAQGLSATGFLTVSSYSYTAAYALTKQLKSPREIALIRAINTLTVEGIRAVQKCVHAGISELELSRGLDEVLRSVPGVEPFFDLVLFGENAACPHCASSPTRKLDPIRDLILIDVGAHLYGYSSDVCRTFFLPLSNHTVADAAHRKRQVSIWHLVLSAQTASISAFRPGALASLPDIAARKVIADAGYAERFTHRVGHGIGIKAHEPPYLHKRNEAMLMAGMVFTVEPGVYLPGNDGVGVRHEDVVLMLENGVEVLSGERARSPWEP